MTTTEPIIGGIIVTYNPEIKLLTENISAVLNQFSSVLIVDNGSQNINQIRSISVKNGVEIIELHNNRGIAYAQNIGIKYYQNYGNDWALMLDQDTVIPENAYNCMINLPQFKNKKTGILGMRYLPHVEGPDVHRVTRIIASGNLVNIAAWEKVGGFDNELFIDQVDFDFDYKLQLAGYNIWQIDSLKLKHDVGKRPTHTYYSRILSKIFGLNHITEHSEFRQYYIYRNSLIMRKRYPEFIQKRSLFQFILRMIILSFSYEHPLKKIKAAFNGIFEAMRYDPNEDLEFQRFKKSVAK
ncbi:glycosyltransferase [Weissella paramesenteroides]|uniref:glycosyltransferase n=1 Tax=Weissella paramesenteroides TaxID=1249 RepID=UPI00240293B5|nr:glycosyltransferase [Weissella paramesenteroides]MDF8366780.1 glycosyltransferase [Weissella paramesenteroides]